DDAVLGVERHRRPDVRAGDVVVLLRAGHEIGMRLAGTRRGMEGPDEASRPRAERADVAARSRRTRLAGAGADDHEVLVDRDRIRNRVGAATALADDLRRDADIRIDDAVASE